MSVLYAEELSSTKSSVFLQRTNRHGIAGQQSSDFPPGCFPMLKIVHLISSLDIGGAEMALYRICLPSSQALSAFPTFREHNDRLSYSQSSFYHRIMRKRFQL